MTVSRVTSPSARKAILRSQNNINFNSLHAAQP